MTFVHRVRFTVELAYSQLYEFFRLLESLGGRVGFVSVNFTLLSARCAARISGVQLQIEINGGKTVA